MRLSVALLIRASQPVILYEDSFKKGAKEDDYLQVSSGVLDVTGDDPVSVGATITPTNQGCSLIVEQLGENILNLSFGINYPPSVNLKLKGGQYVYISIDVN